MSGMRATGATTLSSASTSEPVREASLSAKTLHLVREEMQRRLKSIHDVQLAAERDAEVRDFLKNYAGNFEVDRRDWLRAMVALDPDAISRRLSPSAPKLEKRQRAALSASPLDVNLVLSDRYLDMTLSVGGVGNSDGWFSPAVQAELDALPPLIPALYGILRAARDLVTHDSEESRRRIREALNAAAALDADFNYHRPITERNVIRWLTSNDQARLRRIAEAMPEIWRAMIAAEAVLRAET